MVDEIRRIILHTMKHLENTILGRVKKTTL